MNSIRKQKLEEIAEVFIDGDWIEKKDQSNAGILLIQTGNIGIINYRDKSNRRFITEATFKRLNCSEVIPGDILISRLPDPVGRSCIIPNLKLKLITAVDCTIFRPRKYYDKKFLNYLLNSQKCLSQVYRLLTGASRERISRKNLEKIELPIPFKDEQPDLETQRQIADKIDLLFEQARLLENQIQSSLNNLVDLKDSILNQAFQGKL